MKISSIALASALLVTTPAWADEAADNAKPDNRDIIVTGTKLSGDFGAKSGILDLYRFRAGHLSPPAGAP